MGKPVLGLTLGDPGGVGPEVLFKALHILRPWSFIPVIFGSRSTLNHPELKKLIEHIPITFFGTWPSSWEESTCYFNDLGDLDNIQQKENAQQGEAAQLYIEKATQAAMEKRIEAMVTAPISKTALNMAGSPYTGHTSMLKDLTQSECVSMGFFTPKLKTVLVTIHHRLAEVPQLITEKRLKVALKHAFQFTTYCQIKRPRIAVAGLNPHAGEKGAFGDEEQAIIEPFVNAYQSNEFDLTGPYPADTLYYRAYHNEFDMILSLYHDQGLIPIKLLGFDHAVNVTLGLPFIRTSPDHGTAFDIAYQNKANPESMRSAIQLAEKWVC